MNSRRVGGIIAMLTLSVITSSGCTSTPTTPAGPTTTATTVQDPHRQALRELLASSSSATLRSLPDSVLDVATSTVSCGSVNAEQVNVLGLVAKGKLMLDSADAENLAQAIHDTYC
jgi:hypothetical protein